MAANLYRDGGRVYLELHAMRAPVGNYAHWVTNDPSGETYEDAVRMAVADFEADHDIVIHQLGRSGRHICIEDTPANRRRYRRLQRLAIEAAKALWLDMQTEREPDAVRSEN